MDKTRLYLHCSSSIRNFEDKLKKRTGLKEYHPIKNAFDKVVFFGMYHEFDYLRFLFHRGQKSVFWCGSDILTLSRKNFVWRYLVARARARHFCENEVEHEILLRMGISSRICPMIFDEPSSPSPFVKLAKPHVYISCNAGREEEYGVDLIEAIAHRIPEVVFHFYGIWKASHNNLMYHGKVPEWQFNSEVKNYQAALRWNSFDGFAEPLAKSALMGQHPISRIYYPHITHVPTIAALVRELRDLKNKKKPNLKAQRYWTEELERSLCAVLS